jgi:hypothetical protein
MSLLFSWGNAVCWLEVGVVGCGFKWHPDRHQGAAKAEAEARFKEVTNAYQVSGVHPTCNRCCLLDCTWP